MNKKISVILIPSLCLVLTLSGCMRAKQRAYYVQQDNYINAAGIVTHVAYSDDYTTLYLGFEELTPEFDDTCFKIIGDSLLIVQERGIDEKLRLGDRIEFITAPKYFGDGYIMPIVGITIDGETLLEFEEGYESLMEWLNQ